MKFLSLLVAISAFSSIFGDLPEPYQSINILPFDAHGWFMNSEQMKRLIDDIQPKVVIEVGSWLGLSTRFIAEHISGKVYAIDTWKGTLNEDVHMKDPRLPYLYQQFLSNVIHTNLCDKIIPIRMESREAAGALNIKADLIYIDASHDEESVCCDILQWNPHLNENGVLCGDDWCWETVRLGVARAAASLDMDIIAEGNFWRLK